MRKIKGLLLFLLLTILLVACGEEKDISEQIKGDWKVEVNGITPIILSFGDRRMEFYVTSTENTEKSEYKVYSAGEEGRKGFQLNAVDWEADEQEKILEGVVKNDKLIELTYLIGVPEEEFEQAKFVMKRVKDIDKEKVQAVEIHQKNIMQLEKEAEKEKEKVKKEAEKEKKEQSSKEAKLKEERFSGINQLLATYKQAIKEQWNHDQLSDRGMGFGTGGPYSIPENYGYVLHDIDEDGTPELILGSHREDGYAEINELYVLTNGKMEKMFTSDIRTNIEVYKDGTISESYGGKQLSYFRLLKNGEQELVDGYELEMNQSDAVFKRLVAPFDELSDAEKSTLETAYEKIGLIDLAFEPIIQEKEAAKSPKGTNAVEIEQVVKQNLQEIGSLLIEDPINDLVEREYSYDQVQDIVAEGLGSNTKLYNELLQLLQPKYNHLTSSEGIDAIIQTKVQLYDNPVGEYVFFGPEVKIELTSQEEKYFQVRAKKEIGPQDVGGQSYELIYALAYVNEEGRWKLDHLTQIQ